MTGEWTPLEFHIKSAGRFVGFVIATPGVFRYRGMVTDTATQLVGDGDVVCHAQELTVAKEAVERRLNDLTEKYRN